ncbi:hypothetical protein L195_g014621, partial [Trifolium pratense]
MNWNVQNNSSLNIKLGDGSCSRTKGTCEGLEIMVDGLKVVVDVQLFELGCVDVILGIEWLRTLGDMIVNWKSHTMSFWFNKKWVTMKGIGSQLSMMETLQSVLGKPKLKGGIGGKEEKNKVSCGVLHSLEVNQSEELEQLLSLCADVFQDPKGLPPKRKKEHVITLREGAEAVNVRPYRYPHHHKNEIEKQVNEMMKAGIIRHSTSSFSSPVILVKKKDNSWRMCVDYRALNKATIPDKFPIPVIEELLDELHGASYFSKLDLKSGYHQVRVKETDIHKTAFRTHEGHYEFLVMPFGLMNAPSTFQSLMNEVFKPLLRKSVLVFFDDILVYSKTWSEHMSHLKEVLHIMQSQQLVANKKKCQFGQKSVEYLGHLITYQGVAVDPSKIVSVTNWPIPKNVKGVRGFLGLTGYYRKFIKDYGKIAKPLTELTKKDAFVWNEKALHAFETLKKCLTTAPVLALPNFGKEFVIESDASGSGIGAILMQDKKPIAYFSKALGVRNLAKSAYEKELMAVVLSIQHWRPYLIGRKFIVSTDQKSLKQLLQQRMVSADQQNWAAKLLGYDFDIIYKPGRLNNGADALSRVNEGEVCQFVSSVHWQDEDMLKSEVHEDPQLKQIIEALQQDAQAKPGYEYKNGVLLYEGRLVISAHSSMVQTLLSEFHTTPQGGHSGFYKTYRRIAANLYWIGMKNTVQEFVKACDTCQRQKYLTSSPGGLLQPLPIPDRIWEDLSMDFITGLPKSKGYEAILVIVDRLSKYVHFIPLKHPYTAKIIAEIFVREVVRLHGIPLSIVSDRDPIFMSKFWRELFKLQGTKLKMSTAYHPETDGQTEVVNRCLETYLRCFITDQPRTWANWISWSEYWFNTSYHSATGQTPYEVVYGRAPPVITRWVHGETRVDAVQKELVDRDEALRQLRQQLHRAQDRMKQLSDKKRCDRSFEIGEWVFVKLRAHRQQSVVCRINAKLAARYYGPYPVLERVGAVAYRLKLPEGSKVHAVFHVSLLKKAVGNYHDSEELPELQGEQGVSIEPEAVLANRFVWMQNEKVDQVLIHWKGQKIEEATWEDVVMMKSQFPNFCLEDKTSLSGGSIVRTQNTNVDNESSLANDHHVGPRNWSKSNLALLSVALLIRGMDDKIASLEAEISGVKTTLANMEINQAKLIAMFEKSIGKSVEVGNERIVEDPTQKIAEGSAQRVSQSGSNQLDGEALAEFRRSVKKVELPMFVGEDPAGWISRAEIYFRVQNTRPEIKVNLAQLCMEGPTIHFFNSLINENEELNWEQLKHALLERYGGHGEGDVYEQLTELRQRGSVDDYINDFEYLTAQIPRLPDKQFLGYFLHGLKEEVRGKVRSLSVMGDLSRSKVLQVARAVERETKREYGSGYIRSNKSGHGSNRPGTIGSQKDKADWVFVKSGAGDGPKDGNSGLRHERPNVNGNKRNNFRDRGYSSLSYNEIMERKKKGLCFRCGGANHQKNQCPERHLKVLVVDDDDEDDGEGKLLAVEVEDEEEIQGEM